MSTQGMESHDRVSTPTIQCPYDRAALPFAQGRYGACRLCGFQPDDKYIARQRYFLEQKHEPVIFAWDPEPKDLLFVHPHAKHIPKDSLLVAGPNQVAVCQVNGQWVPCPSGTYALSGDEPDPDIARIAQNLREGTQPTSLLQVETNIVFVDTRQHECAMMLTSTLPGSRWTVRLPLTVYLNIVPENVERLLGHALDLHDNAQLVQTLQSNAQLYMENGFAAALSRIPAESLEEASSCEDIRALIQPQYFQDAETRINKGLTATWGLRIGRIDWWLWLSKLEVLDSVTAMPCPFPLSVTVGGEKKYDAIKKCGGLHYLPKGTRKPSKCPKCGEIIRWCTTCSKYTTDFQRQFICDQCSRKYQNIR
ncbi:MAG: hypothetical protein ACI4MJ_11305 [Aristaeellaceae bacterium]